MNVVTPVEPARLCPNNLAKGVLNETVQQLNPVSKG